MVEQEQHYITTGLPHPSILSVDPGLPDVSQTCTAPTTSAYPDLAPYSGVSTFTLPSHCDSSLLTPISSADSPPLHQGHKPMRHYPPPPGTPMMQQPSPPASSKMYWNNGFEMDTHSSGANSPMGSHGQVGAGYYIPDERRTPGPPEPYMGGFAVSNGPDAQAMSQANSQSYYLAMNQMDHQSSGLLAPPQDADRNTHLGGNLLNQPYNSQFRQPRRDSHEDTSFPQGIQQQSRLGSASPRRRSITQGKTRIKKSKSKRHSGSLRSGVQPLEMADEHKNCHGEEVPPLIKESCPEEERCIFDSRWRHRHQRGQDMWESIQDDFQKTFNKSHGKEMLQMKFKRGRSKYLQWYPRDLDILREAWLRLEKDRYQILLDTFHELGGSRNMLLSPSDIEVKVVNDLRLEDDLYLDTIRDPEIRRRRKIVAKKTPNGRSSDDIDTSPLSQTLTNLPTQHPANPQLEDEVINQVHNKHRATAAAQNSHWEENASVPRALVDVQMWDNRPAVKMEPQDLGMSMSQQAGGKVVKTASRRNGNVASRSAVNRGKAT